MQAVEKNYQISPPIVVNSVPKSGTHLLLQITRALPNARYFGSFIAQTPTMARQVRPQSKISRLIEQIAPGEVLAAHLHYTTETAAALNQKNTVHLFIHRDPRDIVISESHYLANMNKWHSLHKYFKAEPDVQQRIQMAIEGLEQTAIYPDIGARMKSYFGWRDDPNCIDIRYEDLIDPDKRIGQLKRIIAAWQSKGGQCADEKKLLQSLVAAIDPRLSHTFHKGGAARWRTEMSKKNLDLIERYI